MASGGEEDLTDKRTKKVIVKKTNSSPSRDLQRITLNRHRMHRSSVRPFFCCGSQVSLNSITEVKDLPATVCEKDDNDYEDLTDSDDLADDMASLKIYSPISSESGKSSIRNNMTKRKKAGGVQDKTTARKKAWTLKLKGKLNVPKKSRFGSDSELSHSHSNDDMCVCTSYRRSGSLEMTNIITGAAARRGIKVCDLPMSVLQHLVPPIPYSGEEGANASGDTAETKGKGKGKGKGRKSGSGSGSDSKPEMLPLLPIANMNEIYPTEDIDEQRIAQRRQEMENGIEVSDVWVHKTELSKDAASVSGSAEVQPLPQCSSCAERPVGHYPSFGAIGLLPSSSSMMNSFRTSFDGTGLAIDMDSKGNLTFLQQQQSQQHIPPPGVHTQVDYIHYLVPDLDKIVNSSFYWGVMDRYEAEKLIENKPEGTFLLRDSAQEEFLFSVSFRRYGRSLHARIEQWNHKFSFDSRDPGVFATESVCGLIDHYKDPSCCMFFEPMLTVPLHRTSPFSLQHLARAKICSRIQYDSINQLILPRTLKEYLRYYHYKQKIRVRRFDNTA